MKPPSLAARAALAVIRAYKYLISPLLTGCCRFVPSCADYAAEAIARHGVLRGTWLGARRLSRCHPWGSSGLDLVPCGHTSEPSNVEPATIGPRTFERRT